MTIPEWFDGYASEAFTRHLTPLAHKPNLKFLQIGVFAGSASVWLCENVLTDPSSTLDDVDGWTGSEDINSVAFTDVEAEYDRRMSGRPNVHKHKMPSDAFFASTPPEPTYDFAYVDGDHRAYPVLKDAIGAYERVKVGGILAFDDYKWSLGQGPTHDPCTGINAFYHVCHDRLEPLEADLQVWFRKIS